MPTRTRQITENPTLQALRSGARDASQIVCKAICNTLSDAPLKVQVADETPVRCGRDGHSCPEIPPMWPPKPDSGYRSSRHKRLLIPRIKDYKAVGVTDEDAPEESRRQDTVESLYTGILLDASEAEEGHAGQFE
jgi:hypothetical protein